MQQDLIQNNNIIVTGKIISDYELSHQVYGENFYIFKLETARLSQSSDVLPVIISERLIPKCNLKKGDFIDVVGQIRSYNDFSTQKNRLVLTVFAKDIDIKDIDIKDINIKEVNPNKDSNQVVLNGFICKQPVYRTTPFGREIADILLAVNRSYNKSDYIPTIAWGRNARFADNLNIGDNIKVCGRMQSRKYQKKLENGETVEKTAYEVSVSKMELISSKKFENH